MMISPPSAGRRRRRDGRHRGDVVAGVDGRRVPMNRRKEAVRRTVWVAGLVLGVGKVAAQGLVNGGSVALTCDICECQGTSDDGTITVFDNPSSGERIASVNAAYSEILTTSCGTTAIATDSTIYELSGVDGLDSRDTDVVTMDSAECSEVGFDASSNADCFIGPTSVLEFGADVTVDVTFHFATWFDEADGATKYWYKLLTFVTGSTSVDQDHNLCFQNGFVSVVFDLTVLGNTNQYNFEFDFGSPTSADLPVDDIPASTDALVCGGAVTPAPVTSAPETPPPTARETPAPAGAVATTPAPTIAVTQASTAAPLGNGTTTPAPAAAGNETATEAPDHGNVTETAVPTPVAVVETPVPSTADSLTSSPVDNGEELEENGCILPESSPCTQRTPVSNTNNGIGDYFSPACDVPEGEELPVGCDASSFCRTCYFNTPLYLENNNGSKPDYPDCPCCVLETYPADEAANLVGPRCEHVESPAPTMMTTQPVAGDVQRGFESLGFDDAGWEINPGEAAALAALGLLAALTFFPICTK